MPARNTQKKKGRANFYRRGDNNLIDDRTGFKIKASDARREWNNFVVHKDQFEVRQPQDLLRGFPDRQAVPINRPGSPDIFLAIGEVKAEDL